jgi:uncharacterized membrane protein
MAHLLELPRKMDLSLADYRTVQQLYRGWAWLGIFEIGAFILTLLLAITEGRNKKSFRLLITSLVCFVIAIIIFFFYTFPANRATSNWTELPANWSALRTRWEYSHAVRALLYLVGLCSLLLAFVRKNARLRY